VFVFAAVDAAWVLGIPFTSLTAPTEAPESRDLPDADCSAVFFATMAAAPSHIVILLANRVPSSSPGNPTNRRSCDPEAAHLAVRVTERTLVGPARRASRTPGVTSCPAPRHPRTAHRLRAASRAKTGRPLSPGRRTLGGARSMDGDE
jgi:hypothetical protein